MRSHVHVYVDLMFLTLSLHSLFLFAILFVDCMIDKWASLKPVKCTFDDLNMDTITCHTQPQLAWFIERAVFIPHPITYMYMYKQFNISVCLVYGSRPSISIIIGCTTHAQAKIALRTMGLGLTTGNRVLPRSLGSRVKCL